LKPKKSVVRAPDDGGVAAAARVLAAGGRVPKKFARAAADVAARPVSAGPTLGQKEALGKITAARRAAFEILLRVGEGKGHSDELLHGPIAEELSEADRNLATALVMGVLRWEIALDARTREYLQRPDQRLAAPVALALRLGAFQLLHMDRIPAHAALSESVELCRAAGEPHAAGMVNAVLRKVSAARPASVEPTSQTRDVGHPGGVAVRTPIFETTAAFAERLGHPAWMVERWVKFYGREAALKICEAGQTEPAGGGLFPAGEDGLPGIDDGSRLVAEIAAAAVPAPAGEKPKVWDCCAAPGGKTLVIAKRLPAAAVLATDASSRRLGQMAARMKRFAYAGEIRCEVADASALPEAEGEFDLVLCDVPCSGTGTLARNPEIRLRLQPEEFVRQAARQREILTAAMRRVRAGGRLVYSTCSLEPEENEGVVDACIGDGWKRVPVEEVYPGAAGRSREGVLRTLPGVNPCDGFYAVVLEKL
jgi:16S rRNA (cytosine967-C5)-methyltransferase